MTLRRRVALLLFAACMGLAVPQGVSAQQQDGISLISSPLPINLETRPGETVSTELRVKNNGTREERLKVDLLKFSSNDQGEIVLAERSEEDEHFDWVAVSPREFTAQAGEWKSISLTIDVPDSAAFGYYYAVSFSRADQKADPTKTATLEGQLVTFVLLNVVVPGAKRELQVSSFSADRSMYEFLPSKLTVSIKNTGSIHLVPRGNIFIKRGKSIVSTLDINASQGNVLPSSVRTFAASWEEGFPVYKVSANEAGQTEQHLSWDFAQASKLRIGKYTAKLVLVYDDGQRDVPVEAEVSFWVIPWRLILAAIAIPIVPALLVYLLMKRRYRRKTFGGRR